MAYRKKKNPEDYSGFLVIPLGLEPRALPIKNRDALQLRPR